MRLWKVVGLAAFAGVAATGVVVVRAERRRRAYTPQEIRERLHARLAEAGEAADSGPAPVPPLRNGRLALGRLRRGAGIRRIHR